MKPTASSAAGLNRPGRSPWPRVLIGTARRRSAESPCPRTGRRHAWRYDFLADRYVCVCGTSADAARDV